ncbi:MAG TPA: ABC transporter substrate-binding protein [Gemmatimonadaceae bacterium]
MRTRLAFALTAFALAACSRSETPAAGDAKGDTGGTLVIATAGDADALLPPVITGVTGRQVADQVFDRLAEIGPDLNTIGDEGFTPRLAKSWSWAPDSLSIAFALDPAARWHDGRPVRAGDVRFSFALIKDPKTGSTTTPLVANVDSVTVRDSLTPVFWFATRSPEQFYDATYQLYVVPEHVYGSVAHEALKTADVARTPVGSGRFRFVRWDPGSRIELVADTANYRGRAKLDRVIWTIAADPQAALTRLQAGEADFYELLLASQVADVTKGGTLRVLPYPALQYAFMGMNQRARKGQGPHPVFGDPMVRRALSMAVDRAGMLRNVYDSLGKPGRGPFPAALGSADTTIALPPFDTSAARALLDSAGWRAGTDGVRRKGATPLRFTILVPASSTPRMRYAVLLQEQFKHVGAQVELEQVDFPTFLSRQGAHDFDAILAAIGTDPNPGGAKQFWHSAAIGKGGSNDISYANPRVDALLDSASATYSASQAKRYMGEAYRQIVADAPAIWLYDVATMGALHKRVHPAGLRADGWWADLPDWSIPAGERIARDQAGLGAGNR